MATITITVPDYERLDDVADYIIEVAELIRISYSSGHVDTERHWTTEGVR